MTYNIIFSGFGGQGILFMGKAMAQAAMNEELNVSWLPSYGPEMRGGACNCTVIISDEPVGSPIISRPDILVAMNIPSFLKFGGAVEAGGLLIADSTFVTEKSERTDIRTAYIPATAMANDNGLTGGANVIILGYMMKLTGIFSLDVLTKHIVANIPATKTSLIENNKRALKLGYEYEG